MIKNLNPVIKDLIKLKIINKKNIYTFYNRTRDVKIKVLKDKKSGFAKIKIIHYQRYNFNNHLGWFIKKIPGGHEYFKHLCDQKLINEYNKFITSNKFSDTLIAIASK